MSEVRLEVMLSRSCDGVLAVYDAAHAYLYKNSRFGCREIDPSKICPTSPHPSSFAYNLIDHLIITAHKFPHYCKSFRTIMT